MGKSSFGSQGPDPEYPRRSYDISLEDLAKADFLEAIENYESQSEGLGERFELAVDALIGRIAENPFQYQSCSRYHRRAVMDVFPYVIYFAASLRRHRVLVPSIHHAKRHLKHWRRREPIWRD